MKRLSVTFFFLLICLSFKSQATHLRAADIIAERISEKRYEITLTLYTDFESVSDGSGDLDVESVTVEVAGESLEVNRTSVADIGNATFKNEYSFEYEFPVTNANYIISYTGIYRNNGIINMAAPSHLKALYVETYVRVDDATIGNGTPLLLNAPIDLAAVGQEYTHNPGAWDPDGDSISFLMLTPQLASGVDVDDYRFPNHPSLGASTFSLDPVNGDISWVTPTIPGEYNIAFMIEEWRNGARIGYVIRDMQILVEDTDNEKPELLLPNDTCLASGQRLIDTIIAYDPDNHSIELTLEGGLSNFGASLSQNQLLNDSIVATFTWDVSCDHVQNQSHDAVFRVEDNFTVPLSSTESWAIRVIAEAPRNFQAFSQGEQVLLSWDSYECESHADALLIWRSSCDSGLIERDPCLSGVPDDWGYELLESISPTETSFIDSNEVFSGSKYCYLVSAEYGVPSFGESYASDITCVNLDLNIPFISSVSVLETAVDGVVGVSWEPPLEFDNVLYPGPYRWELFQSSGSQGQFFNVPILDSVVTNLFPMSYLSNAINTIDSAWSYKVILKDQVTGESIATSNVTSTVWLDGEVRTGTVDLVWMFDASWSQDKALFDLVYDTTLIKFLEDSLSSANNAYTVFGLENGEEYCYVIHERYGACHDSVSTVYESVSNRNCFIPLDTVPPCAPFLSLEPLNCDNYNPFDLSNELSWLYPLNVKCEDNIEKYELFVSDSEGSEFSLLDSTLGDMLEFSHNGLTSVTGCYKIRAVDDFGNKSSFSNTVCQDGCDSLVLPNVFTPNGDTFNGMFLPKSVKGLILSTDFTVYNRWGKEVFRSDLDPNINWEGADSNGRKLSDGVYYYIAKVQFDRLFEGESEKIYTGWITLIR